MGIFDMQDPMMAVGMGLLSSNAKSRNPQNPMAHIQNNLMMGQQMKQQQSAQLAAQQKAELEAEYKRAQIAQMAAPKAPAERRIIKGADGRNYYADDQTPVLSGVIPKQDLPAGMQKNPVTGALEYIPAYLAGQEKIRAAGKNTTDVRNVIEGTDIEDPIQAFSRTQVGTYSDNAATAYQREQDAGMGLEILKSRILAGDDTGKWAPMATDASAYLGLNPDQVANAQLFDVKMGDKVMARIAGTKGSVSEREMTYFTKISPGSDKEPFTNYVLLEIDRRAAVREQDKLEYLGDYLQENKGNILGFDRWYMKNHDPFGSFNIKELKEDFGAWSAPQSDIPQGTIEEGYKYIGGDPAKETSWRKEE